jgi:hypothetical protein
VNRGEIRPRRIETDPVAAARARPRVSATASVLSERHALVHSHARLEPVVGLPAIAAKAIVRVSFPWVAALSSVALADVGRGY